MALTNTVASVTSTIRGLVLDKIRTDGRAIHSYTGDNRFSLKDDFPDSTSIVVLRNSTPVASQDFSYDSDTNKVVIEFVTSGLSLATDDTIDIRYDYYKKYSDAEIKGYLESSLSYFPLHRYKKTFEINDSDEIVAVNKLIPDINELYFIAYIASILIDPQNVEINIPDLKITSRRDKSDQDQIKEAFRSFKRHLGAITLDVIHTINNTD